VSAATGSTRIDAVRDRTTFRALAHSPARIRRGPIRIAYVPGTGDAVAVGYVVSKRCGTAVRRNRIRRRLRAALREAGPLHAGCYLVTAAPETATYPFSQLVGCVRGAATDAAGGDDD
jgi:ribonuclease P protein component